jgi:hypothetical protein
VVVPLSALELSGEVAGLRVLNPVTGELSGREGLTVFDAILVQRQAPVRVAEYLAQTGLPFVYDLDDLIINPASYRQDSPSPSLREFVALAARLCHRLTVPHLRLLAALERNLGARLSHKAVLAPNLCPLREPVRRPSSPPRCLVWTSSDAPALTQSKEGVLRAVREFSRARNMPVRLVGDFDPAVVQALPHAVAMGPMDYWRHKLFLLNLPPSIGLAPLETGAQPQTQEFVDCKSDVKMVEYGGFGHAGVYSRAAPHLDTDLTAGLLAANTAEAWRQALEEIMDAPPERWADESLGIVRARSAEANAPLSWGKALAESRTEPLPLRQVMNALGFRHMTLGNSQGACQPHHRLADLIYHGLYLRITPTRLRGAIGRWCDSLMGRHS